LHSTVSDNKRWFTIDIKDFYLGTPLPSSRYEYVHIKRSKLPPESITGHNLEHYLNNNAVYFEIRKCMYGLPQVGRLSQLRLISHLQQHGYHQCVNTPCLFKHETRDIMFCLVVDDFGIGYGTQDDVDHLIQTLQSHDYELTIKPTGDTYLGMNISFTSNSVTISMPSYVEKMMTRFRPHYLLPNHRPAAIPGKYALPVYSKILVQRPIIDTSAPLSFEQHTEIQAIVGTLLYYARAVDPTLLPIANELASQQASLTQRVLQATNRALSYATAHPNNSITYHSCDTILHGHVDASYLSLSHARSVAGCYPFLGDHHQPLKINSAIHTFSTIIPCIVSSAGEAEYAALFAGAQHAASLRTILADIGHPQPPVYSTCRV
jgi:hypothetical protein